MITLFRPDTVYALAEVKEAMAVYIKKLSAQIFPMGTAVNTLRYELNIEPINILHWLHNQKADTKIYWSGRDGDLETGGIGIADIIKGEGTFEHQELFAHVQERLSPDNPHLRYYGGMSFDPSNQDKDWEKFGAYQFIIPQFEIVHSKDQTIFAFNIPLNNVNHKNIERAVQILAEIDFSPHTTYRTPPKVLRREDIPDKNGWESVFSDVIQSINGQEYEKIVLARKSIFDFDVAIRPNALIKHLKDQTPDCFHFCFQPCADTAFLGATPERLYKREERSIKSEAIAGTRPRGKNEFEDQALGDQLMNSVKDAAEHQCVVDAVHAALKPFCDAISSDETFRLQKLSGSQHLTTSFDGTLKNGIIDDQILNALHPTPAVAGCPTKIAMNTIKTSEPFSRGWYAGPVGYIGHDSAEFAVAIRSGLINKNKLSLYAGAGIVAGSVCESEWSEIENKISNFIGVFHK